MNPNESQEAPISTSLSADLDEVEEQQHQAAIRRLCEQHPEQQEQVREYYLDILASYHEQATIRTYLSVLVSREVELALNKTLH